jgi:hypothetical protein
MLRIESSAISAAETEQILQCSPAMLVNIPAVPHRLSGRRSFRATGDGSFARRQM